MDNNYLTRWNTPGVERIISYPLCFIVLTFLTSLPAVAQTDVFRFKSINQGKAQAMLLVHPVVPIAPETRCCNNVELQHHNVVVHYRARTINRSKSFSGSGRTFCLKLWSTAPVRRGEIK
jgi:hypothetical protein